MALATMQLDGNVWLGSSLTLLDLYNSGGITLTSLKWLERPYFPRLRWLGLTETLDIDLIDGVAESRPYLHVCVLGEELGTDRWVDLDDTYMLLYDERDEYDIQHIQEEEEMEDAWDAQEAEDFEFQLDKDFE